MGADLVVDFSHIPAFILIFQLRLHTLRPLVVLTLQRLGPSVTKRPGLQVEVDSVTHSTSRRTKRMQLQPTSLRPMQTCHLQIFGTTLGVVTLILLLWVDKRILIALPS